MAAKKANKVTVVVRAAKKMSPKVAAAVLPPYSFCESATATSISPWCIRKVTPEVGQKFGGGVDTPSLCQRVKVSRGWDLQVPLDSKTLKPRPEGRACPDCLPLYRFELWYVECSDYLKEVLGIPDMLDANDPYELRDVAVDAFHSKQTPKEFIDEIFGDEIASQENDIQMAHRAEFEP